MILAYAALKNRNYRATEEILLVSLSKAWSKLTARNLNSKGQTIVVTILEILKTHQALSSQLEEQVTQIKESLLQDHPSLELPLANVIPNCHCEAIFSILSAAKKLTMTKISKARSHGGSCMSLIDQHRIMVFTSSRFSEFL